GDASGGAAAASLPGGGAASPSSISRGSVPTTSVHPTRPRAKRTATRTSKPHEGEGLRGDRVMPARQHEQDRPGHDERETHAERDVGREREGLRAVVAHE